MSQQIHGSQIRVGEPDDNSYGINVPGITASDSLPVGVGKLLTMLVKKLPLPSPGLSNFKLSLVNNNNFITARHCAPTASVPGNIIWNGGITQSATPGATYAFVFRGTNPVGRVTTNGELNEGFATFSDGRMGVLQAFIDNVLVGYRNLDPTYYDFYSGLSSPDVGSWNQFGLPDANGALRIVSDGDPYISAPFAGFYTSLTATMSGTGSFVQRGFDGGEHIYSMSHSTTGEAQVLKFICDNGTGTPPSSLIGNPYLDVITQSSTTWITGIPSVSVGDILYFSYSVANTGTASSNSANLISRFYNSGKITEILIVPDYGIPPLLGDLDQDGYPKIGGSAAIPYPYQPIWRVFGLTYSIPPGNDIQSLDLGYQVRCYNPAGGFSSFPLYSFLRISNNGLGFSQSKIYLDTYSKNNYQVRSGDGLYPTFGTGLTQFGDVYDHTKSIIGGVGETYSGELMHQLGIYQYPTGDYTQNYPVSGPNYDNLDNSQGYANYRWVTFNLGTVSSVNKLNLQTTPIMNIQGVNGYLSTNLLLYTTIISGTTSQVGWLDANLSYTGGNSPRLNGDGCLVYGDSDGNSRRITFGTFSYTGQVFVRFGINAVLLPGVSSITLI